MSDFPCSENRQTPNGKKEAHRLLWDWPTRLFHWILAALFLGALTFATLSTKFGTVFLLHMVFGVILLLAVLFRVVWGFVGSGPSRFRSFLYSPKALFRYIKEAAQGKDKPSAGHNPGSSYAIYAMVLIPIALAITGIAQWRGLADTGEIHEALVSLMIAAVAAHLLGLAWHTIRHRENIAMSMVHGNRIIPEEHAIPSSRPWAGVAFLVILAVGSVVLVPWLISI